MYVRVNSSDSLHNRRAVKVGRVDESARHSADTLAQPNKVTPSPYVQLKLTAPQCWHLSCRELLDALGHLVEDHSKRVDVVFLIVPNVSTPFYILASEDEYRLPDLLRIGSQGVEVRYASQHGAEKFEIWLGRWVVSILQGFKLSRTPSPTSAILAERELKTPQP